MSILSKEVNDQLRRVAMITFYTHGCVNATTVRQTLDCGKATMPVIPNCGVARMIALIVQVSKGDN